MRDKSGARYAGYALALLTAINLLSYINRSVIFALFPSIERDLRLTDFHAGWLASAYVVVYSLAALPLGILSDLRSRRAVVAGGIGLWSVFTCLAGLAQGFGQLILCRAAVGIGGAAAAAAGASLVADYFPDRRRAVAMGVYMAGIPLGGVLGILAGGELEGVYGWRLSFVAVGLPGFLLALLVAQLRDPTRPPARLVVREYLEQLGLGARTLARRLEPSIVGLVLGAGLAWYLDHLLGADSALDVAAFGIMAGTGFALNIRRWVLQVRAAPPEGAPAQPPDVMQATFEEVLHAVRVVLRTPTLVYIFVGGALISFGMNGLVGWAPTFMSRELGLSVRAVSVLIGKWGLVFGIAGTLFGGFLADWLRSYTPTARVLTSGLGFLFGAP
ncbi:MAG: MFS transporter, partial [Gemmatimonadales bacterium]